ncbi:calcium:cation antiporter [Niabella aquatica]
MKQRIYLTLWTIVIPVLAWLAYWGVSMGVNNGIFHLLIALLLVGSVLAAVHHAEVVAHRVGEPFGTLVLALAITVIEVALIVSLMLTDNGHGTAALARDTVLAAVMIILTGIVGICLLVGGVRYREQVFSLQGVSAALVTLTAILVFTLILPNFTTTRSGSEYTPLQLGFVATGCLILYIAFTLVQAIRHRAYFLPPHAEGNEEAYAEPPTNKETWGSVFLLILCLGIVVLLAKVLAPDVERSVTKAGAPKSLVGIIIAAVVLLPEGLAAFRAARKNRLQTSLNLAFGSALASIGLTIPAVAVVSITTGMKITLGIDMKAMVLLVLAQFTIMLSLATGRTNILQGIVLLMIFAVYIFLTIAP